MVAPQEKPLVWIGGSKKDLMALSADVRKFFGHALDFAQRGDRHDAAKVMKGFGGAGVLEASVASVARMKRSVPQGDFLRGEIRETCSRNPLPPQGDFFQGALLTGYVL